LGDAASPVVPLRRFQFSIASLFAWTTAVAVLLGLFPYAFQITRQYAKFVPGEFPWTLIGELCLGQAAIGLAVLWAAMGTGQHGRRAAALVGAFIAAMLLHARWADLATASFTDYSQVCLLEAALIFAPLWVFRVVGYRVIIRRA
jgi:hypothetical protein